MSGYSDAAREKEKNPEEFCKAKRCMVRVEGYCTKHEAQENEEERNVCAHPECVQAREQFRAKAIEWLDYKLVIMANHFGPNR